jgi:hypothetical protein
MAQTQMCTNDNFDDSNRTPIMKRRREVPKHGASHFFDQCLSTRGRIIDFYPLWFNLLLNIYIVFN